MPQNFGRAGVPSLFCTIPVISIRMGRSLQYWRWRF